MEDFLPDEADARELKETVHDEISGEGYQCSVGPEGSSISPLHQYFTQGRKNMPAKRVDILAQLITDANINGYIYILRHVKDWVPPKH